MRPIALLVLCAMSIGGAASTAPLPSQPFTQTYTLITVTQDGDVKHSDGWVTLNLCRDAESIARTGMTVAEAKKRSDDAVTAAAKANAAWLAKHPPHPPTNPFERLLALNSEGSEGISANGWFKVCAGHQICEEPPWVDVSPSVTLSNPRDIKYAACVVVP